MSRLPLVAALLMGLIPATPASADAPARQVVKILVLNFDPAVPAEGGRRLHDIGSWQDPRRLATDFSADVERASGGRIVYKIIDWVDVDALPIKVDGFRYSLDDFERCGRDNKGWHDPDRADYPKLIDENKIGPRIDSGEVDEVWLFGPPYSGFFESCMAGPGAFWINGDAYPKVPTRRPFVLMGFNYERGIPEMLHDLAHRTESTMARVFGGWKADELTTDWAKFAACVAKSSGAAGCGNCHFPPNAARDYDYDNPRVVASTADDWLTYPRLTGRTSDVSRETWGGPDYHRNYLRWWFAHLPHADGIHPEHGRQNNWWSYVFDWTAFTEDGRPLAEDRR